MNDRRRIAEEMGWQQTKEGIHSVWWPPKNKRWRKNPPNPFTDANDDYAVLEWMRGEMRREGISLLKDAGILSLRATDYQIGDYARAALKVMEGK